MATKKQTPKKRAPAARGKPAPAKKTTKRGSSAVAERRVHTPEAGRSTRPPATSATTPKVEAFVQQYLVDFNATRAYQRSHPGVTDNTARVEGSRLLTNPDVQARLADAARKTAEKMELTRDRIFLETARLAFFDPRKLFKPDGSPRQVSELDDDTAAAIAGLEVLEEFDSDGAGGRTLIGHVKKYRVADKNAALERAAKLLALFKEDNAQKGASVAQAFAQFLGQLHGNQAGKLPIAAPKARPKVEPS